MIKGRSQSIQARGIRDGDREPGTKPDLQRLTGGGKLGKTALISGVTGQDGSYLAHLLLGKGYRVFGPVQRGSRSNLARLEELHIAKDVELVDLDLLEFSNILRVVEGGYPRFC